MKKSYIIPFLLILSTGLSCKQNVDNPVLFKDTTSHFAHLQIIDSLYKNEIASLQGRHNENERLTKPFSGMIDSVLMEPLDTGIYPTLLAQLFNRGEFDRLACWYEDAFLEINGTRRNPRKLWRPELATDEDFLKATMLPEYKLDIARDICDGFRLAGTSESDLKEFRGKVEAFIEDPVAPPGGFGTFGIASVGTWVDYLHDFWKWYDKSELVPDILEIQKGRMSCDNAFAVDADSLYRGLEKEKDAMDSFDARCVLAIEMFHMKGNPDVLADLLEEGMYSKYLLEVYRLWRVGVQKSFGTAEKSFIPQIYYDYVLRKVAETYCNHLLSYDDYDPDDSPCARCMYINLYSLGILYRNDVDHGYSISKEAAQMRSELYLPPGILGYDTVNPSNL